MQHLLIDLFCQATCHKQRTDSRYQKYICTFQWSHVTMQKIIMEILTKNELQVTTKTQVNENKAPQAMLFR